MTRTRFALAGLISAAIIAAPLASASAHRHRGFPLFWPFLAAGAVVGTAAAIATAPFAALAAPPGYYYPPPAAPYYAPPAAPYYAPPAAYYPPPGYYGYGYYR